jgi:hypothetical protein
MTIKIWFYVMRAFGPVAAFMLLVGTIYAALEYNHPNWIEIEICKSAAQQILEARHDYLISIYVTLVIIVLLLIWSLPFWYQIWKQYGHSNKEG